jgi:hypothetical protein
MGNSGLSALIRLGAELENALELGTIAIGKSLDPSESYMMETSGAHLCYRISLRNDGGVWLSASLMDGPGEPDLLWRDKDTEAGWQTLSGVVSALERSAVKSLQRPIEARGYDDANSWLIA